MTSLHDIFGPKFGNLQPAAKARVFNGFATFLYESMADTKAYKMAISIFQSSDFGQKYFWNTQNFEFLDAFF